jgi:hypothetical protein
MVRRKEGRYVDREGWKKFHGLLSCKVTDHSFDKRGMLMAVRLATEDDVFCIVLTGSRTSLGAVCGERRCKVEAP